MEMMERLMLPRTRHALTVGLFGIGLDAYWPQFPGLRNGSRDTLLKSSSALLNPARAW